MPTRLLLVFATLLLSAPSADLSAQQGPERGPSDSRGVWYQGRFFGYVPAHEKRAETQPARRSKAVNRPRLAAATVGWHGIQTGNPSTEPAPSPLPLDHSANAVAGNTIQQADIPCCGNPSWWGRAEYLLFWTRGMDVPALATSGSAADAVPAALGQPGTQTLFGAGVLNEEARSGGRFTLGKWLDPCRSCGWEVSYLALDDETTVFGASNSDFAVLGRPFLNTTTAAADARLIADPAVLSGSMNITVGTDFQSLEVLYRRVCSRAQCARIDFVFGYRFAELEDRLRVDESTLSLAGASTGTSFDLFDQFDTRNTFHGAQFGLVMQWQAHSCWSWEGLVKVAIGGSGSRIGVSGQTITTDSVGNATTTSAGLLAQGTNIGTFRLDEFATLSEFGLSLKGEFQSGMTVRIGYAYLYWSDVARAGDQIDTTINPTQIPPGTLVGEARPANPFRVTDFWAQGLRFGLEYNF